MTIIPEFGGEHTLKEGYWAKGLNREDIIELLKKGTEEAKTLTTEAADSGLTNDMLERAENISADYEMAMDDAEEEITREFDKTGKLSGTRVCDISHHMDGYTLSVAAVRELLNKAKQEGR